MNQKEKEKYIREARIKNILFYIMLAFVVGLCIYAITWIHSDSYKYTQNPFGYSMQQFEEKNNATASCIGTIYNSKGSESFTIDDKGIRLSPVPILESPGYPG